MNSEMVERGGRRGGEGNGLVGVEVSSSLVDRRHADACNRDARVTTITREAGTRKCQIANNLAAQVSIAAAAQRSLSQSHFYACRFQVCSWFGQTKAAKP